MMLNIKKLVGYFNVIVNADSNFHNNTSTSKPITLLFVKSIIVKITLNAHRQNRTQNPFHRHVHPPKIQNSRGNPAETFPI